GRGASSREPAGFASVPIVAVPNGREYRYRAKATFAVSGEAFMSDFNVGFVIFPGITQLDFTGPFEVLSRLATPPSLSASSKFPPAKNHVVAKDLSAVIRDRGLAIMPTCTFQTCPPLNLLCIPGGAGVADALADGETIDFIRREGARADYVT